MKVPRAAWLMAGVWLTSSISSGESPTWMLSVVVHGARSDAGQVGCSLYGSARGFPVEPAEAVQLRWCGLADRAARCSFAPAPPGVYGVACFHDENGNAVLDRGLLGIPVEGFVVSREARGLLGPPSFEAAQFGLERDTTLSLRLGY